MLTMLSNWKGELDVNGEHYTSVDTFIAENKPLTGVIHINLYPEVKNSNTQQVAGHNIQAEQGVVEYRITVKKYMTQKTEPGSSFDFMERMNGNNPMPMRTMVGRIIKQTPGMVYMELRGQASDTEVHCMRCGRTLTNAVSKRYGIGPECLIKLGFAMEPDLVDEIKAGIQEVTWTGWIIRSAITEQEEITNA